MTDTTTRLLRTWERFPETRAPKILWDTGWRSFRWARRRFPTDLAHAVASDRIEGILIEQRHEPQWLNKLDGTFYLACRRADGRREGVPGPTRLDALISAYWASKGEQEPSP